MAETTRVVLADDDVLLRAGLASLLEGAGFDVVGQADDGGQLLDLVRAMTPDLVVTDIRMPPTNTSEGLDAARQIRQELPDTAIMVLSAHVAVDDAMDLLAAGDRIGYLLKSRVTDVADFIDSLERVARGGVARRPGSGARTRLGAQAGRPAERAERARERSPRVDGRGSIQCRYRAPYLGHRGHSGEAHPQHPEQAELARDG